MAQFRTVNLLGKLRREKISSAAASRESSGRVVSPSGPAIAAADAEERCAVSKRGKK